jgi:transcriptional regulator with XRE-family HTH domain
MVKLKTQVCNSCGGIGTMPAEDVGAVLREEREKAGVSQKDVAGHMGISDTFLYDLEKGNRRWTNEYVAGYRKAVEELANGR